jgi:hypothetical protein
LRHEKEECRRAKTELEQLKRQQPHVVDTPTSAENFTQRVLELATRQQGVERRQREQRASLTSSGEYSNLSNNNRVSGDGSGQFRDTEVAGTAAAGTELASTEVAGTEAAGTERAGTERAGTEVAGMEGASTERVGTEVAATEAAGTEGAGAEVAGTAVAGTEGAGTGVGTEVAGTETINVRRSSSSLSVTREPSPHTPMQRPRSAGSIPTAPVGNLREHHEHQQDPPIVGPVIHDDGTRVYEEHREWKTGRE